MASWAYACRSPDAPRQTWYVACVTVDTMPPGTDIVRVRAGSHWHCARVDRSQRVAVDGALMRDVVASDADDCPGCAEAPASPEAPRSELAPEPPAPGTDTPADAPAASAPAPRAGSGREVHAAAVAMQGRPFVVVLVSLDLVRSPGEADMAITELRRRFGGAELVLMGQLEDGTPEYHGDAGILALLAQVPVDRMPWKVYPLG
jgi:hypothetical protein